MALGVDPVPEPAGVPVIVTVVVGVPTANQTYGVQRRSNGIPGGEVGIDTGGRPMLVDVLIGGRPTDMLVDVLIDDGIVTVTVVVGSGTPGGLIEVVGTPQQRDKPHCLRERFYS